jgi:hypothetical protein
MKKITLLLLGLIIFISACKKYNESYNVNTVTIQLKYPSGSHFTPKEGIVVKMTNKTTTFEAKTDSSGIAKFSVPIDIYDVTSSDSRSESGVAHLFNATKTGVVISSTWVNTEVVKIDFVESTSSQVIIKEVFTGGTPKDDGSGAFAFDKYITLYNNSSITANLGNLCIGMISPFNSTGTNNYYANGKLIYQDENWMPAVQGYWYFTRKVSLEPYSQIVIAVNGAVNHTLTYSKSINFDNSNYFAMYDITGQYKNASSYPSPVTTIPTGNYLKAATYATANAWSISVNSPGVFIFDPKETTPVAFAAEASSTHVLNVAYTSKKVPTDWILDGVEAYVLNGVNTKRFLPSVDAGQVNYLNNAGYSIYRNVDVEATKAITGNTDKLVYNYNYGTTSIGGTTDPSGIDAEASIKKGAKIIYKDTNNSTNDFHMRSQASLRTN